MLNALVFSIVLFLTSLKFRELALQVEQVSHCEFVEPFEYQRAVIGIARDELRKGREAIECGEGWSRCFLVDVVMLYCHRCQ